MDLINLIWTNGLSFIFILSVIVFGHELGHYVIARWNGVRVEIFSIGFGPELFGWDSANGTRWKVSLLPLGGYVKMFGDADASSKPGEDVPQMSPEDRAVSFHHKPLGQRTAIILGGPLANFVLAIIILACMFATVGQRITPADISIVQPDSPAEAAGMMPGDRIIGIDGQAIDRFEALQMIVRASAGEPLNFTVLRDGAEIELVIVPRMVEVTDRFGNVREFGQIGIGREGVEFVRLDPLVAIWAAVEETWYLSAATLEALGQIIAGTRGSDELGGPILIAQVSGQVAEDGLIAVFWFMALLSINLGLINLFPIPMLDGGHLLFYVFEAIRGRPLSERAQEYGFRIGLAMVLTLMIFVTWKDLDRLQVVDFFINLFS
ncbi:MAG: RIP metalloprotease RseP [Gemmatimonadetes bacterium]|nr:RIP metalloprotease RseP [Gemmatimonadota bacterium]